MAIVVSGMKPTGVPHLGNLIGMLEPAARLAARETSFFFVADLHALTTLRDPQELRAHVYDVAAALLAAGLDAERSVLFRQSDVPEILQVTWVLGCLAPMPVLERAHAYKAAVAEDVRPSLGLFSYPVLMAADILTLGGDTVPVGPDQKQHVEITRDLARRFNSAYGDVFPLPRAAVLGTSGPGLPGIDGRKMSKRYGNTIPLDADPDQRGALVRRIVTDSSAEGAAKEPERSHVVSLYRHFASEEETRDLEEALRSGGTGWKEAKEALAAVLDREVEPVRRRFLSLRADVGGLEDVLRAGARRARERAAGTIERMRELTGIGGVVM